jgi:hypothetical protein
MIVERSVVADELLAEQTGIEPFVMLEDQVAARACAS